MPRRKQYIAQPSQTRKIARVTREAPSCEGNFVDEVQSIEVPKTEMHGSPDDDVSDDCLWYSGVRRGVDGQTVGVRGG